MEKCEHCAKITHFCIYDYCSVKQAAGCESCIKKYHSHAGHGEYIKVEDIEKLAQKFNVQNSLKPKCRQFQEYVFGFFTQVKTEISQTIDMLCKGMVNKIGYPFLSRLNHLSTFKRIKNNQYKKLTAKELKKMHQDCRGLDFSNVAVRERELYIEEIIQNFATVQAMQRLMRQYESLANKLCKSFKHDSSPFKKIQDIRKYLFTVLKIDDTKRQVNCENNQNFSIKASLLETSPSDQKDLPTKKNTSSKTEQKQQKPAPRPNKQQKQIQPGRRSAAQNRASGKYKHMRNFSIEKEARLTDSAAQYEIKITKESNNQAYESKEKQIFERKEKLMKIMSLKQKSIEKLGQNGPFVIANNELLIPLPLLKHQKKSAQTATNSPNETTENKPEKKYDLSLRNKVVQTQSKVVQTLNKHDLSINLQTGSSRGDQKQLYSIKSFKEQLAGQSLACEARNQEQEQKYKYGMMRLPSSQSNFSDVENLFKFDLNPTGKIDRRRNNNRDSLNLDQVIGTKTKHDRLTESLQPKAPSKTGIDSEIVTEQEKSAGLYLIGLEKTASNDKITYFKGALSYSPRNLSAAEMLGWVYIEQDKAKECLDLCNEYVNFLTKLGRPELRRHFITNKSAALNMLGRYSESIMLLESQIVHFEESKMYKNLGDAYFAVGINQKCQYNYEKAVRLNPQLDEAMYNLAVCIFSQGNFFNADMWISKALQTNPKHPDYKILKRQISLKLAKIHMHLA